MSRSDKILEIISRIDDDGGARDAMDLAKRALDQVEAITARFERMHAEHMALIEHMTDKMLAMASPQARQVDSALRDGTETPHLGRVNPSTSAAGSEGGGLRPVTDEDEAEVLRASVLASTNPYARTESDRNGPSYARHGRAS